MSLFSKNSAASAAQPKEVKRFTGAISNSYLAMACTVINILLFLFGSETYLLFSIYLPYISFDPFNDVTETVFASAVLVLYFLLTFFAKKRPGLIIPLFISYLLDTVYLAVTSAIMIMDGYATPVTFLLDYLFHIWILVYMILGLVSLKKYKAFLNAKNDEPPAGEVI